MTEPSFSAFLWPGRSLILAAAITNRPHRHLSASLIVGIDRPFLLGIGDGPQRRLRAALVAPNVWQSLDTRGGTALVVHLDPDVPDYRKLMPRLGSRPCFRPARWHATPPGSWPRTCTEAAALLDAVIRRFSPADPVPLDPRVAAVTRRLREHPGRPLDVNRLASDVGLSPSRLMHLFSHEMGLSLRRFLLNLRIQAAMRMWRPGMTLAELAAAAGFYDQPHLVRTARELFDAVPSSWADARRVRVVNCVC